MDRTSLEILALVVSLVTFVGGCLAWYSAAVVKQYAAQRDFQHLTRSYEQLSGAIASLHSDIDRSQDLMLLELRELKGQVTVLLVKLLPETSGSLTNRDPFS